MDIQKGVKSVPLMKDIKMAHDLVIESICQTINLEKCGLTGSAQLDQEQLSQVVTAILIMEVEGLIHKKNGLVTLRDFLSISKQLKDGTPRHWKLTELTMIMDTLKETSRCLQGLKPHEILGKTSLSYIKEKGWLRTTSGKDFDHGIDELSMLDRPSKKKSSLTSSDAEESTLEVYDLLNVPDTNMFEVIADEGEKILVHNCLGYQYSAGASAVREQAEAQGVVFTLPEMEKIRSIYHKVNKKIITHWATLEYCAKVAITGKKDTEYFDGRDPELLKLKLPSGRKVGFLYPKVNKGRISYLGSRGENQLYGGKLFNYFCQGTGRDLLSYSMLEFPDCVILSIHDEVICEGTENYGAIKKGMEKGKGFLKDCQLIAEGTKDISFYGKY